MANRKDEPNWSSAGNDAGSVDGGSHREGERATDRVNETSGSSNRRSFIKLVGAATASLALPAAAGRAAAAEYETVTVSSGQTKQYNLDSGQTLSNLLIDISAQGADVSISARGQDWTIRNVGIRGRCDTGSDPSQPVSSFVMNVGGSGTIENVYLGDGIADGVKKGALIYGDTGADHHVTMRNTNMAEWWNAIYAAGGAASGRPTLAVENCYFRDNANTHMRVAEQGTYAKDSVFHNTGKVPKSPGGGTPASRGFWPYSYGTTSDTVEIRNCELDFSSQGTAIVADDRWSDAAKYHMKGGNLAGPLSGPQPERIELTDVGSNPDTSVPAGVPTSAKMAASGGGSSGGDSTTTDDGSSEKKSEEHPHSITITGPGAATYFRFTVTGEVAGSGGIESNDTVSGSTVEGGVWSDSDTYEFSGKIESFEFTGSNTGTIVVNGTEYTADSVVGQPTDSHSITITGPDAATYFRFTVTGEVAGSGGIESDDTVSGSTVEGGVWSDSDTYEFSGKIESFEFTGSNTGTIVVNGTEYTADSVVGQP